MIQNSISDNRIVWLDVIRCVAMIMVIGVHCIDPFYISPTMRAIPEYTHWAAIYGSLAPSVGTSVCYDDGTASAPRKKTTTG